MFNPSNFKMRSRLFCATIMSFSSIAGTTLAATASDAPAASTAVGEVVVTARDRTETLIDTPLSVTVLGSGEIQRANIQTFQDITRLTPSLVFDKGFSLQDTRPVIRGLPSSRGRPPVGVLVDGVDVSSESMGSSAGGSNLLNLRALDVERIEVVEGPQSALYGRVAFGGAVNYITKKPSQTFGAEIGGEAGQFGTYEIRGAITGPINDQLAFRANAYGAQSDGFYKNNITGNSINGYKSAGGGFSLNYEPVPQFTALASVVYSHDEFTPSAQYYLGFANGTDVTVPLASGVAGVVVGTGAGAPLPASVLAPAHGTFSVPAGGINLSRDPYTGNDFPGATLNVVRAGLHMSYRLGDFATLTSITSYTHATFSAREDTDFYGQPFTAVSGPGAGGQGEPLQRSSQENDNAGEVTQWNQELRLGRLDGGPFRWAIGGLYWFENYQQNDQTATFAVPAPFSAGLDAQLLGMGGLPQGYGQRVTQHYSVYGIAEYDFLSHFTASFEGRVARETYSYIFSPLFGTAALPNAQGIYPIVPLASPTPATSATDYFTPKVLLRYTPTDDLMVYTSAARGVKPGGFSTVATSSSATAQFKPEKLWNYEVGFKDRLFDRHLLLSASGFYMRYTDKQEALVVPVTFTPTGFVSEVTNIGGAEIKGVEASATLNPIRDLTLSLAYTYLDAKYTDYRLEVNSGAIGALINSCTPVKIGTGTFCETNLRGNRLERSPENSLVASGRYSHPITELVSAFIEGDLRYTGNRPDDEYNKYFIPAATSVNVRIGAETGKWNAFVYIDNIFDNRAIAGSTLTGDPFKPGSLAFVLNAADPRAVGVRFSYKY